MKIKRLDYFYIITNIKEHKNIKKTFIDYIKKMPNIGSNTISKTDWSLSLKDKNYIEYFKKSFKPYLNKMANKLTLNRKKSTWNVGDIWYQIYNNDTKDYHSWHNHPNCNFANIYFLHLPNKNICTQFYDIVSKKSIKNINIKEGQLITFPASLLHRSPPNVSNDKKIIISFNSNIGMSI